MLNYKKVIILVAIVITLIIFFLIYIFMLSPKAIISIENISIESLDTDLYDPFKQNSLLNSYGASVKEIEGRETNIKIAKVECQITNIGLKEITLPYIRFVQGQELSPEILGDRINRLYRDGVTPISFMEDVKLTFGILVDAKNYEQIIKTLENIDIHVIDYNKSYSDYEKCAPISKSIKLKVVD